MSKAISEKPFGGKSEHNAGQWRVAYLPEADEDFERLDGSQRLVVRKAIGKVATNPVPDNEGGYGKMLSGELSGFLKIKLKRSGLRVVYKLARIDGMMLVIVISARADEEVYDTAAARVKKHGL